MRRRNEIKNVNKASKCSVDREFCILQNHFVELILSTKCFLLQFLWVSAYIEPKQPEVEKKRCFENSISDFTYTSEIPLSRRLARAWLKWNSFEFRRRSISKPENDHVNELSAANGESHQLHHALQTINFKVWSLTEDLLDNKSKIREKKCFNALLWTIWPVQAREMFKPSLKVLFHTIIFFMLFIATHWSRWEVGHNLCVDTVADWGCTTHCSWEMNSSPER